MIDVSSFLPKPDICDVGREFVAGRPPFSHRIDTRGFRRTRKSPLAMAHSSERDAGRLYVPEGVRGASLWIR
jgi:hypothetical protein